MSGIEDFIGTMRSGDDSSIDQWSVANRKSIIAKLRKKSLITGWYRTYRIFREVGVDSRFGW